MNRRKCLWSSRAASHLIASSSYESAHWIQESRNSEKVREQGSLDYLDHKEGFLYSNLVFCMHVMRKVTAETAGAVEDDYHAQPAAHGRKNRYSDEKHKAKHIYCTRLCSDKFREKGVGKNPNLLIIGTIV